MTWAIPWVYVALMIAVYVFAGQRGASDIQNHIRSELQRYLIVAVFLVLVGLAPVIFWRWRWLTWASWFIFAVAVLQSAAWIRRGRKNEPSIDEPADE
ncbi:MAG: hypothetical protein D6691_07875 [Candidatus Hydrogenedentota bacterium]|jgi:hypothetical protein|uniref:Uncharacterized protein n=1 Tax=Sumerlaea chitinivorans TaxID=2250252 RepID=A0A2Z4Y2Y3_SUMC1|nr:hypothetical protein BRCON_0315 [Candidatus Sumerlaea chitinivorans]MCX7964255.1 hypothetical protein [Candidatus Sumerlaea chitinivorans]RMH26420.1 MAG: hypothetical protein D6691_07875 [Candidatus Hydrogenedentota bacterium]GIX45252.1 MAG: hypothetical protein KatS3mg130_1660 [Candidatus Sumerlaea sp.]